MLSGIRDLTTLITPQGLAVLCADLDPGLVDPPTARLVTAMRTREVDAALALPARTAAFAATTYEAEIVAAELEFAGGYFADMPLVPPGGVVLDIGAHIGLFSLAVLRTAPRARLVAVEPFDSSYRALRRNLSLAGAANDAVAVRAAIAATPGRIVVNGYRGAAMLASAGPRNHADLERTADSLRARLPRLLERGSWGPEVSARVVAEAVSALFTPVSSDVPALTLSDLMRQHDIDRVEWLKIDVEGGESAVLDGVEPPDWPRIGSIVAEVSGRDLEPFAAQLRGHGFDTDVRPLAVVTRTFGADMFLVRGHGPGHLPAPVRAATVGESHPLSDIYEHLREIRVREWPGRHAIIDLSLDGAPLALPWREHGIYQSLLHGESWARYLLDRYAGADAGPQQLTAVFGGDWSQLGGVENRALPALVAARMTADQAIDRLVRATLPGEVPER